MRFSNRLIECIALSSLLFVAETSGARVLETVPHESREADCFERSLNDPRVDAWREDLSYLIRELEKRHPNLFHTVSREEFEATAYDICESIPSLDDLQIVVALARLTATIGDGHTGIFIPWDRQLGYSRLPIEIWEMQGALMIAAAEDPSLVGAEILKVGESPVDRALRMLDELIPRDNQFTQRHVREWAIIPEVLAGLGLIDSPKQVRFEVEDAAGARRSFVLQPVDGGDGSELVWSAGEEPTPPWIARRDELYWFETLPDQDTLYIQYNDASWQDDEESLVEFTRRLVRKVEEGGISKVVLDLRWNSGGSARWTNILLHGMIRIDELLGQPRGPQRLPKGRSFTLIGPGTFSAATDFAFDLEEHTNTLFVGFPTGGRPNHYGDVGRFRLPSSNLEVRHSRLRFQNQRPFEDRSALTPDLAVPLTIAEYRRYRDPVLQATLEYEAGPELAERLLAALEAGELHQAREAVTTWEEDSRNAFRGAEAIVNGLARRVWREGEKSQAIDLLRLNVDIFPESASAHESLGEGLLAINDKRAARAALQKAIELDREGTVGANARRMLERIE